MDQEALSIGEMLKTVSDQPNNKSSQNGSNSNDLDDERFTLQYGIFLDRYIPTSNVLHHVELALIAFGLLGNILALCTLGLSKKMQSPSFVYHKALVVANLAFCVNYSCVQAVDRARTNIDPQPYVLNEHFVFGNYIAAYYSGVLKSVIASCCGYMANYMCLLISLDRFAGMTLYRCYLQFNNRRVAWRLVLVCLLLSAAVHSWAAWIETSVIDIKWTKFWTPVNNSLVPIAPVEICCYTWVRNVDFSPPLTAMIKAKNVLNLVTRLVCALSLTLFTASTLYFYVNRWEKKKRQMQPQANGRKQSTTLGKATSLFILMTIAVVLFYIENLPREAKRILELVYPMAYVVERVSNKQLPMADRLFSFNLMLYMHQYSQTWLNLFAVINHTLLFYCYMAGNVVFRRETCRLFTRSLYASVPTARPKGRSETCVVTSL